MTTMTRAAFMLDPFGPAAEFAGWPVRDLRVEYAGPGDFDPSNPPVIAVQASIPLCDTEMAAVLYAILEYREIPEITPEETRRIITETVVNGGCSQVAEYAYTAHQALTNGLIYREHWQACLTLARAAYQAGVA